MNADSCSLLTVGIPTWNRCQFLREMILSVTTQAERYGLVHDVEVVVSDNASADETPSIVADLQAQTPVRIRYHRNDMNLGPVKNILNTVVLTSGRYLMMYGDDDLMADGALPLILQTLRKYGEVPAFMFKQSPVSNPRWDIQCLIPLSITEAAQRYFYYIGNAGVFALKTQDAQSQLQRWGVERFQTCWPTTQLAFLAMAASDMPEPVLAVPVASSCSPNHTRNTVYTSWYIWETMFFSLYRTALELRSIVGQPFFEAACAHIFAMRRTLNIATNVFLYTTLFDLPQDSARTREVTRHSLRHATRRTLLPLLLMWLIAATPRPVKLLGLWSVILLRWPIRAGAKFRRLREAVRTHQERRLQASERGATKPRLYGPGDL